MPHVYIYIYQRKSGSSKEDWNLDYTYSMSFNSMYLDFPQWALVNLP